MAEVLRDRSGERPREELIEGPIESEAERMGGGTTETKNKTAMSGDLAEISPRAETTTAIEMTDTDVTEAHMEVATVDMVDLDLPLMIAKIPTGEEA